jgi:hypothetical protein
VCKVRNDDEEHRRERDRREKAHTGALARRVR